METLDDPQTMEFKPADQLAGIPDEVKDVPIGPMMGVATIALNMAMKYCDIITVQDGALYQQYKLEGRNMHALHLDYVFDCAIRIEEHIVAANKRVAKMLVFAALDEDEPEAEPESGGETITEPA